MAIHVTWTQISANSWAVKRSGYQKTVMEIQLSRPCWQLEEKQHIYECSRSRRQPDPTLVDLLPCFTAMYWAAIIGVNTVSSHPYCSTTCSQIPFLHRRAALHTVAMETASSKSTVSCCDCWNGEVIAWRLHWQISINIQCMISSIPHSSVHRPWITHSTNSSEMSSPCIRIA